MDVVVHPLDRLTKMFIAPTTGCKHISGMTIKDILDKPSESQCIKFTTKTKEIFSDDYVAKMHVICVDDL
jgi:hypothetical protein